MTKIGIRELKNQTSQVLREVRENLAKYVITHQGKPVAVLHPYGEEDAKSDLEAEREKALQAMKSLSSKVAEGWTSSKDGIELVAEQRR